MTIAVIGLDLAKNVFQIFTGIDELGHVVLRKQLRRQQVLRLFLPTCRCVWLVWKPVVASISGRELLNGSATLYVPWLLNS